MSWPPRFIFLGGSLAIDFAQTGGEGFRARWERWHAPSDLQDWAEACPDIGIRPEASAEDLAAARALREALWHTARQQLAHRPPAPAVLALIESHAAQPDLVPTLREGRRLWAQPAGFGQVLSAAVRDVIALFGSPLAERFRECANPLCYLMFVDRSRPGKRQWCAMERCGNLTKVARHRARAKGDDHAH